MPRRRNTDTIERRDLAGLERRVKLFRALIAAEKEAAALRQLFDDHSAALRKRRKARAFAKEQKAFMAKFHNAGA